MDYWALVYFFSDFVCLVLMRFEVMRFRLAMSFFIGSDRIVSVSFFSFRNEEKEEQAQLCTF